LWAEYKLIAAIQALYIFAAMLDVCWLFVGLENFKLTVMREMVIKIVALILIVTLVKSKEDLLVYIIIMAVSSLSSALFLWKYVFRFVKFTKPSWYEMKIHLKPMIILFIPAIMENFYSTIDKIMLGNLYSKVSVGLYENAEKALMTKRIISTVGVVATPKMATLFSEHKFEEIREFINKSMKLTMVLAYVFAFGTAAIAYEFSVWFWGSEFSECGTIITGLSLVIPIWTVGDIIRTQYLIPQNLDKQYILSVCAGTVVNIGMNFLLIPRIGIKGAVIGTMLSEFVVLVCQAIEIRSKYSVLKAVKPTLVYCLIGIIMYIAIYPLKYCCESLFLRMIIKIAVGGSIFTLLSYMYGRKYDKDMIDLLVAIIKKKKRR
jgi:O-antigen/teichoic acid export membrane protein